MCYRKVDSCFYLVFIICGLILSCQNLSPNQRNLNKLDNKYPIFIQANDPEITLYWDKPAISEDDITGYNCLYRESDNGSWVILKQNIRPTVQPKITIKRYELDTTQEYFSFAIQAVLANGEVSPLHKSTDLNAKFNGWLIKWKKSGL